MKNDTLNAIKDFVNVVIFGIIVFFASVGLIDVIDKYSEKPVRAEIGDFVVGEFTSFNKCDSYARKLFVLNGENKISVICRNDTTATEKTITGQ